MLIVAIVNIVKWCRVIMVFVYSFKVLGFFIVKLNGLGLGE